MWTYILVVKAIILWLQIMSQSIIQSDSMIELQILPSQPIRHFLKLI
jgi:hypothetical protein